MSYVVETLVDPEIAAAGGGKILTAATNAKDVVPGAIERIRAGCAAKPWGTDEGGQACDAALSSIVPMLDTVARIVDTIGVFGDNIVTQAANTLVTDIHARDSVLAASLRTGTPL